MTRLREGVEVCQAGCQRGSQRPPPISRQSKRRRRRSAHPLAAAVQLRQRRTDGQRVRRSFHHLSATMPVVTLPPGLPREVARVPQPPAAVDLVMVSARSPRRPYRRLVRYGRRRLDRSRSNRSRQQRSCSSSSSSQQYSRRRSQRRRGRRPCLHLLRPVLLWLRRGLPRPAGRWYRHRADASGAPWWRRRWRRRRRPPPLPPLRPSRRI